MGAADQILAAVNTAAAGTGVKVSLYPPLDGAMVTGWRIQAYVFPVKTGFQVEMWRGSASDAFSITAFTDLGEAAAAAVAGCTGS